VVHASTAPEVLEAGGRATLDQLAGGAISLSTDREIENRTFRFYLPAGAKQGPNTWYTMHLNVEATFARDTGKGSLLVSALTNNRGAAQVNFYPGRRLDGSLAPRWSGVNIFDGSVGELGKGRSARANYVNLLQISGVKPGLNTLTLQAQRFGKARLSSVKIASTSGVYTTSAGPVELALSGTFTEPPPKVGKTGNLRVKLLNKSPRPAEGVEVTVQPLSPHLFIDGPSTRVMPKFRRSRAVDFRVGSSAPGPLRVGAVAFTVNGERASTEIVTHINSEDGDSPSFWRFGVVIGLLGLGAGAAMTWRRNRRKGRS
jgi:hypothetical protein